MLVAWPVAKVALFSLLLKGRPKETLGAEAGMRLEWISCCSGNEMHDIRIFFFDPINAREEKSWVGYGQAGFENLPLTGNGCVTAIQVVLDQG